MANTVTQVNVIEVDARIYYTDNYAMTCKRAQLSMQGMGGNNVGEITGAVIAQVQWLSQWHAGNSRGLSQHRQTICRDARSDKIVEDGIHFDTQTTKVVQATVIVKDNKCLMSWQVCCA